ncbi:hypothetical protein [Nitratifractor salsuginis]|uniref:Uncharacterized protein n=1 Tax=Nitratifractor salsuginis (strain DSM 16511 / JCM 12458 / E9I37-1) TaxID=749222 RepID=E6WZ39_NITSE|nr:hypothetical protein [Nitratifractor salsuginis]ADV45489.1 hypothetical protein Nitsa_0217 [Nitratifractor salsuginis DSM 16511]
MNNSKNNGNEVAVLLRHDVLNEIEKAVFSIDGMAKAIRRLAGDGEGLDDEMSLALQHLAEAVEEKAKVIQSLTIDEKAEFVNVPQV